MIAKITSAYIRTYTDNGQRTAYVEWIDESGDIGRTEGCETNPHMIALMTRARCDGIAVTRQAW